MSQSFGNQPPYDEDNVLRMPRHLISGGDQFEALAGKVGHFLERGFSLAEPTPHPPQGTQLDLDQYCIVLIPKSIVAKHPGSASGNDSEVMFLDRKQLLAQIQSSGTSPIASVRSDSEHVMFGDIHVDFRSIAVRRNNRSIKLRPMEFKVLKYFLAHSDRVVSRDELLNEVWGFNSYPCTRTVDNHVLRLRKKLEPDPSKPVYFHTLHGFGYRFTPSGDESTAWHADWIRSPLEHQRQ